MQCVGEEKMPAGSDQLIRNQCELHVNINLVRRESENTCALIAEFVLQQIELVTRFPKVGELESHPDFVTKLS